MKHHEQSVVPVCKDLEMRYTPLQSAIARTGVREGARRLGRRVVRGLMQWTTTRPTPARKARQSWVSEVRA